MPKPFATCDLCDVYKSDHSGQFKVMPPVFVSFGALHKFCGPVTTLRCFEDNALLKAALDEPGAGRVLVVDGGMSMRRALLGGNLGAAAARNGWSGVLIDGCVRDRAELAVLRVGIVALACVPMPPEKHATGERGLPVRVQGHWIHPGDWLFADEDGVVVGPPALLAPGSL